MTKRTRLQSLGRAELEVLVQKTIKNQERNQQTSARVRQAKKDAGLPQVSIWIPRGAGAIERLWKFADLPPIRPSFITRVLGVDIGLYRVGQARRARSP